MIITVVCGGTYKMTLLSCNKGIFIFKMGGVCCSNLCDDSTSAIKLQLPDNIKPFKIDKLITFEHGRLIIQQKTSREEDEIFIQRLLQVLTTNKD